MAHFSREALPDYSRPDLNIEGQDIDELRRAAEASQLEARIFADAQKSIITQYSRYLLAGAGGIGAYVAGAMTGGGLGYAAGYLGASVASYAAEQITGIPIAQDLAQFGGQAVESITSAASSVAQSIPSVVTEWFPVAEASDISSGLVDNLTHIGTTFYAHLSGGLSGISFAGFVGQRTAPYGWAKGDTLGKTIGTKISLPFLRLHAKAKRLPQEMANLFEA